jgi:hypothetical protein
MRAWQNPTPAMDVWYDDIAVSPASGNNQRRGQINPVGRDRRTSGEAAAKGEVRNPYGVLFFTNDPSWPPAKFQETGTYRAVWRPSYQETKSPAGQGRGEAMFHGEGGPPAEKVSSYLSTGIYREFAFGTRAWGALMPAMDACYDDIAISTTRIGRQNREPLPSGPEMS